MALALGAQNFINLSLQIGYMMHVGCVLKRSEIACWK